MKLGRAIGTGIAAFALTAGAAVAGSAGGYDHSYGPAGQPSSDPAIRAAARDAQIGEHREQERRATPSARRERQRSRVAYRDLSRGEALALARSEHRGFVVEPFWRRPSLRVGERITDYTDRYTALVERPGRHNLLLQSTAPLTAGAHDRPVDTTLESSGGRLAPANAPLGVSIARDARGGVRLGDAGITLRVAGTDGGSTAAVRGDKAFFADVGDSADTDLIVGAAPHGIEAAFILRSVESPEDPAFALDLPEGAELRVHSPAAAAFDSKAGTAEIVQGDRLLATVEPPLAADADGQRVPVSYEARGNQLVARVHHRERDVHYPILVDPYVVENYSGSDFVNGNNPSPSKWTYFESIPPFHGVQDAGDTGPRLYMDQGQYYPDGDFAQYYWDAPGVGQIVRVDFRHIAHDFNSSMILLGITNGAGSFQGPGPATVTGLQTDTWRTVCTDTNSPCSSGGATEGNRVVFRFQSTGGGNPRARSNSATLGEAEVNVWENRPPSVDSITTTPPQGWVDSGSHTFRVSASDIGFGVKSVSFQRPSLANPPTLTTAESQLSCTGNRFNPCPASAGFPANGSSYSYNVSDLPEGDNVLGLRATDFIGNYSAGGWPNGTWDDYKWHVKVDRSAPTLTSSGALWDDQNVTTSDGTDRGLVNSDESVTVDATDGSTAAPRSGVASIEMRIDGQLKHPEDRWNASCTATGCPYHPAPQTFTLHAADYPNPGDHNVDVIVRDKLADPNDTTADSHVTVRRFQVYVSHVQPAAEAASYPDTDPDDPSTMSSSPPEPQLPPLSAAQDTQARAIVAAAAGNPLSPLNTVIGLSTFSITDMGELTNFNPVTNGEQIVGAFATVTFGTPHNVDATVPTYSPPWPGSTTVIPYQAHFTGDTVEDVIVSVDFTKNAVIDIRPGPNSSATAFDPAAGSPPLPPEKDEDAPVAAQETYTPPDCLYDTNHPGSHNPPKWEKVRSGTPPFLNYDGDCYDTAQRSRDWPVTVIFWNNASPSTVQATVNYSRGGRVELLPYKRDGKPRFAEQQGHKSACNKRYGNEFNDVHFRPYDLRLRTKAERWGYYMPATTHIDHRENKLHPDRPCYDASKEPKWGGYSERAEKYLMNDIAAKHPDYRIVRSVQDIDNPSNRRGFPMQNKENSSMSMQDSPQHIFQSDGRASLVRIP